MPRFFSPEEANELLPQVRALVEGMVRAREKLAQAEQAHGTVGRAVAGNGGGLDPQEVHDTREAVEDLSAQVARAVAALSELGVIVKDAERGLVDFPSRRGEEIVLLCWQLGEERVAYWHSVEDGFAGRQPLEPSG
jgi:hypothetical protein